MLQQFLTSQPHVFLASIALLSLNFILLIVGVAGTWFSYGLAHTSLWEVEDVAPGLDGGIVGVGFFLLASFGGCGVALAFLILHRFKTSWLLPTAMPAILFGFIGGTTFTTMLAFAIAAGQFNTTIGGVEASAKGSGFGATVAAFVFFLFATAHYGYWFFKGERQLVEGAAQSHTADGGSNYEDLIGHSDDPLEGSGI